MVEQSHPRFLRHSSHKDIRPARQVVAIGSGKGGVGKTTIAVNLALALSGLDLTVGIFDCDIYAPNVPRLIGVSRTAVGGGYLPSYRREDSTPYIEPLTFEGVKIMSIGFLLADHQPINPHPRDVGFLAVQTIKDIAWGELDYLILDMPPGWGELHETVITRIRIGGLVAVTTPNKLATLDTFRSVTNYQGAGITILGLIKNMSYFLCPNCGERHNIFASDDRIQDEQLDAVPLLGEIPLTPSLAGGVARFQDEQKDESSAANAGLFIGLAKKVIASFKAP